MKKVFAILIASVMLASTLQVSIDHHYCGGVLAGTRLSLTGRLASCGMEKAVSTCTDHSTFEKKCCEDKLTNYKLGGNYFPVSFKLTGTTSGKDIQAFTVINNPLRSTYSPDLSSWVQPPGAKLKTGPALSAICVYRI